MVRPVVVLSACLEHNSCRYDGSYIASPYVKKMKEFIDFKLVCPEVGIGLPSPREALRLVLQDDQIRLVSSLKGEDYTDKMEEFTKSYIRKINDKDVDGFLLKSKSPSCGVSQVKLYKGIGKSHLITGKYKGIFGGAIQENFPNLPVEHEKRLTNDQLREHFFTQIYTIRRFKEVRTIKELVQFHSVHKYLFMVYNQSSLKRLGHITANHEKFPINTVLEHYLKELHVCLSKVPNSKRNINMLLHIYGYFKKDLKHKEKSYFLDLVEKYNLELIPLSTLLSLLKSWVVRFENEYLMDQIVFEPFPMELTVFQ